ncbi:MAG: hypothetical protein ABWW65_04230 [Thermoprotei archaeon]
MKGVLPIVIALTIVFMLTLATLYYTTTMVSYTAEISMQPAMGSEWNIIREEILSILLTSLRRASQQALQKYIDTFLQEYRDLGFYEDPSRVITRTYWWRINSYIYYKYSYFSSTVLTDPYNPDYEKLNEKNLYGFNLSYTDYIDALRKASSDASVVLTNAVATGVSNWEKYRESLGYGIEVINLTAYMTTTLESNSINGSIGIGKTGASIVVDVYSPWSGYKRFNETVEVVIEVVFKRAISGDKEYIFPLNIKAYVNMGGYITSYILDPGSLNITIYSNTLHRMSKLKYYPGNPDYTTLKPIAGYYHGEGINLLYYSLDTVKNLYVFVRDSAIYNMSLSDPYIDWYCWAWVFQVPYSEDEPDIELPRHTMTIFWGALAIANIDGIYAIAPIKIVFGYRYMTDVPGYCWVYQDEIVGDENMINWTD